MRLRGFTLVELVMVIVITGIIAATASIFFKPAVDSYFDARRRAMLTDTADTALRRIGRDIRSAVSNSVRSPNNQCFEFIPTNGGGRYRYASDMTNDASGCAPSATCSAPLNLNNPAVQVFDSLSPLAVAPAVNDYVVIDNQNTNDAYAGTNRAQISAVTTPARATDGLHRITVASTQFPSGYDGYRFVIVPNTQQAVFYSCVGAGLDAQGNGTGVLYRVANYGFNAAYPAVCRGAGGDIVAKRLKSCNFIYSSSQNATQQNGFVWMQLEVTEANETVSLSYGVHVDNVP
jgi:MSHA biogenesis protein MshO